MTPRPDNALTDQEIEDTARQDPTRPASGPGSRSEAVTPWAMWGPSVLGETVVWQHLEIERLRDQAQRVHEAAKRVVSEADWRSAPEAFAALSDLLGEEVKA